MKNEELPIMGNRYYLDGEKTITGTFIGKHPTANFGAYFDSIEPLDTKNFIRDDDYENLIGFSEDTKFELVNN